MGSCYTKDISSRREKNKFLGGVLGFAQRIQNLTSVVHGYGGRFGGSAMGAVAPLLGREKVYKYL